MSITRILSSLLLLHAGFIGSVHAQQLSCGTDQLHLQRMLTDTNYIADFNSLQAMVLEKMQSPQNASQERQVIFIPLVVHVIHLGEPVGTGSNISDEKIYTALYGLNARFNNWVGSGVDVDIVFALANRDPYGCPTTGINRVNGISAPSYWGYGIGSGGPFCIDNDSDVKDLSRWPVLEYYNIWVVHSVCNGSLGGYASYPSWYEYDGTVISASNMTNESYALSHEVGHGLYLFHTFEGGSGNMCPVDTNCLTNGDRVCDTPPHKQGDCDTVNPCDTSGIWENSRYNYMSYCGHDEVLGRFSQDQKDRMLATLVTAPRKFLLESPALQQPDTTPCKIEPFITTWNTSIPGYTPDTQIFFPGKGRNYTIEWESVVDTSIRATWVGTDSEYITFPAPGIYRVMVTPGSGSFRQIEFNNELDRHKLVSIDQWGDISWQSMENAFYGCSNMNVLAIDTPNLFNVFSMANMFNGCIAFNAPIGHWATGHVRTMESLFSGAGQFNQDIGDWNTSAVTTMEDMFRGAVQFNQDIGKWDTGNVFHFSGMFYEARSFNQDIGEWNMDKASSLREMFYDAEVFNQDIGNWNTSNVFDMSLMFEKTDSFNQDISGWNTDKVRFLLETFREAAVFNQDLSSWNTSNVISMIQTFYKATAFNQDLGSWKLLTNVNMFNMLDFSGMDCDHYSATLIGWQSNNPEVIERKISAQRLKYGTNAVEARNALIQDQQWTISGDAPSGFVCEPCLLTASISPTHTTCGLDNGQVEAQASGGDGISFTWDTGDTTATVDHLPAGVYSVTISDQNGCTLEQFAFIEASEALALDIVYEDPHLIAQPVIGKPPFRFVWSTGDTTNTIIPASVGLYTVTVTDADSCLIVGSYDIITSSFFAPHELIRIYPNLVSNQLFIEVPGHSAHLDIALFDMNGKAIWNRTIQGEGDVGLHVADLPQGTYLMKVMDREKSMVVLFIKT